VTSGGDTIINEELEDNTCGVVGTEGEVLGSARSDLGVVLDSGKSTISVGGAVLGEAEGTNVLGVMSACIIKGGVPGESGDGSSGLEGLNGFFPGGRSFPGVETPLSGSVEDISFEPGELFLKSSNEAGGVGSELVDSVEVILVSLGGFLPGAGDGDGGNGGDGSERFHSLVLFVIFNYSQ